MSVHAVRTLCLLSACALAACASKKPGEHPIAVDQWAAVSAGDHFTLGVRADGTLWAWGQNGTGQLGDGTTLSRSSPVEIGAGARWVAVSAGGQHGAAIRADGTLWTWGWNQWGELGLGFYSLDPVLAPSQVGTDSDWAQVSCGRDQEHTLALKRDGSLWGFGENVFGELGNGSTTRAFAPVLIGSARWATVAAGSDFSVGLQRDGTLWTWGLNSGGRLGTGDSSASTKGLTPVQPAPGQTFVSVSTYYGHVLAVRSDGTLWGWGASPYGQVGVGNSLVPRQLGSATDWALVSAGESASLALKRDGSLWALGDNGSGQYGDGTFVSTSTPVSAGSGGWATISAGADHGAGLRADGTLWVWGFSGSGELGLGVAPWQHAPRQVGRDAGWRAVAAGGAHSLGLRADGSLWAWGSNAQARLGDAGPIGCEPRRIGTEATWAAVAAGQAHSLALKQDSTLWAWGANSLGQLGDGTYATTVVPRRIGATTYSSLAAGGSVSLGRNTAATLLAWGENAFGQIGQGGVSPNEPAPRSVGLYDAASTGGYHVLAIRSGLLAAWGLNTTGQLGIGSVTAYEPSPRQVGSDVDWARAAAGETHSVAVKTDGTLWTWGDGECGQLGTGAFILVDPVLAPTRIGAATDWAAVAAGAKFTLGLRQDGTLHGWGKNDQGQVGDGSRTNRAAPVRVGAPGAWDSIAAGPNHALGIKKDGTLWAWGENLSCQLGVGPLVHPSPVQLR